MGQKKIYFILTMMSIALALYYSERNGVLKSRYSTIVEDLNVEKHKQNNYTTLILKMSNYIQTPVHSKMISYLKNINNESVVLGKAYLERTLILRFTESDCGACYSGLIERVKSARYSSDKPIVVLATFSEVRQLRIFAENLGESVPVYNIEAKFMKDVPFETLNEPYFFCIESGRFLSHFFLPDKSLPDLTDAYIKATLD